MGFAEDWARSLYDATSNAAPAYQKSDQVLGSRHVDRKPLLGSVPGYQLVGDNLRPVDLVDVNRWFHNSATDWELDCSAVVTTSRGPHLQPVVDSVPSAAGFFPVIAHHGNVRAEFVKVTDKWLEKFLRQRDGKWAPAPDVLNAALKDDSPAFVTSTATSGGGWTQLENGHVHHVTVITNPMGRIVRNLGFRRRDDSIEAADPDLIFGVAGLIVSVGARIGGKIIKSIVLRAERRAAARELDNLASAREAWLRREQAAAKSAARGGAAGAADDFIPQSGMTQNHFAAFKAAAREEQVIVLVRNTNPKSTRLIELGAPGKPKNLEFLKTSADDGIVTVTKTTDLYEVYDKGYFVVGNDKVARRLVKGDPRAGNAIYEELRLNSASWEVKPGQVLEARSKMPIVGDYDLMGVINPANPGQNLALVASEGRMLADWSNPLTRRFANNVNAKMGNPNRVLHGAQDAYGGFRGGAVGFFPDGTVRHFATEKEVEAFYNAIKRQPRTGSYGPAYTPPADGKYPPLRVVKP